MSRQRLRFSVWIQGEGWGWVTDPSSKKPRKHRRVARRRQRRLDAIKRDRGVSAWADTLTRLLSPPPFAVGRYGYVG